MEIALVASVCSIILTYTVSSQCCYQALPSHTVPGIHSALNQLRHLRRKWSVRQLPHVQAFTTFACQR